MIVMLSAASVSVSVSVFSWGGGIVCLLASKVEHLPGSKN